MKKLSTQNAVPYQGRQNIYRNDSLGFECRLLSSAKQSTITWCSNSRLGVFEDRLRPRHSRLLVDVTPGYARHVAQCKQWIPEIHIPWQLTYKSEHLINKVSCHPTSATGTLYKRHHNTEKYKHLISYHYGYLLHLSSREYHQRISRPQHITGAQDLLTEGTSLQSQELGSGPP